MASVLGEIGRLREQTFRLAGEGTGRALDLDRFDEDYEHLFLWNAAREEIAGAYRVGETERLLARRGVGGLYTSTLFRFQADFFRRLGPALELGRSFVRPEYQRQFHPLLLLWKGIGQFIVRRPECRRLFGPVSVSATYSRASRELMAAFLATRCGESPLARLVEPRRPFRTRIHMAGDVRRLAAMLPGLEDLCSLVEDLEPGRRPVPVLLRQYLNLGGRFLAFNVDARFAGVLDGLVLVDLLETNAKTRERHLGAAGARRLVEYHEAAGRAS
jgi:putative hemolysin